MAGKKPKSLKRKSPKREPRSFSYYNQLCEEALAAIPDSSKGGPVETARSFILDYKADPKAMFERIKKGERAIASLNMLVGGLIDALEDEEMLTIGSNTFEGGNARREGIEHYLNVNVQRFIVHVNEVGTSVVRMAAVVGESQARRKAQSFLRSTCLRDLEGCYTKEHITEQEGERRALVEKWFKSDALSWGLTQPTMEGEGQRQELIALFLSSGVDTSVQAQMEKESAAMRVLSDR